MNKQNLPTDNNLSSGTNISLWIDTAKPAEFKKLEADEHTDVVIVGAGISGLSVAYALLKKGKKVIVVEDGLVGSGETGRTTAHLVNALDDRYSEIERIFGEEGARLAADSHTEAINYIEHICEVENIDCDFKRVSGYLFLDPTDKPDSIEKEFKAIEKTGIPVKRLKEVPHMKVNQKDCIEFPDQAQFHPMKYLNGLAKTILRLGGKIYTRTHADKIDASGITSSDGHRVNAAHIVVATNSPVNNKYVMHLKQYAYRSYVIAATIKKGSIPFALWWDTGDHEVNPDIPPYHYVRLQPYNNTHDLLIVGGNDHPTGLPEAMHASETATYSALEGWARGRFDIIDVVYRWSGQVLEPMDAMGYIGRNPMDKENVYIVTGDSGNGMTHGTIAGMLISDLIIGANNPWEKLYNPARINFLKAGKTFLKEFFGGFLQYLKYKPKNADDIKLSDIRPGDAKVIKLDREYYGAYRDPSGDLHVVSATCTHLGCTVRWNADEKSWDCPCHGSRFTYEGKILNGPAKEELVYYREKEVM